MLFCNTDFKKTIQLNMIYGTASSYDGEAFSNPSYLYHNEVVEIEADDRTPSYLFNNWVINSGDAIVDNANSSPTNLRLAYADSEVEANYYKLYKLNLCNGTGRSYVFNVAGVNGVDYLISGGIYYIRAGISVTVKLNGLGTIWTWDSSRSQYYYEDGGTRYYYDGEWNLNGSVNSETSAYTYTFNMPTYTANNDSLLCPETENAYLLETVRGTITHFNGNPLGSPVTSLWLKTGETANISANDRTGSAYRQTFNNWTKSGASSSIDDVNDPTTFVTMGTEYTIATANYYQCYRLTITSSQVNGYARFQQPVAGTGIVGTINEDYILDGGIYYIRAGITVKVEIFNYSTDSNYPTRGYITSGSTRYYYDNSWNLNGSIFSETSQDKYTFSMPAVTSEVIALFERFYRIKQEIEFWRYTGTVNDYDQSNKFRETAFYEWRPYGYSFVANADSFYRPATGFTVNTTFREVTNPNNNTGVLLKDFGASYGGNRPYFFNGFWSAVGGWEYGTTYSFTVTADRDFLLTARSGLKATMVNCTRYSSSNVYWNGSYWTTRHAYFAVQANTPPAGQTFDYFWDGPDTLFSPDSFSNYYYAQTPTRVYSYAVSQLRYRDFTITTVYRTANKTLTVYGGLIKDSTNTVILADENVATGISSYSLAPGATVWIHAYNLGPHSTGGSSDYHEFYSWTKNASNSEDFESQWTTYHAGTIASDFGGAVRPYNRLNSFPFIMQATDFNLYSWYHYYQNPNTYAYFDPGQGTLGYNSGGADNTQFDPTSAANNGASFSYQNPNLTWISTSSKNYNFNQTYTTPQKTHSNVESQYEQSGGYFNYPVASINRNLSDSTYSDARNTFNLSLEPGTVTSTVAVEMQWYMLLHNSTATAYMEGFLMRFNGGIDIIKKEQNLSRPAYHYGWGNLRMDSWRFGGTWVNTVQLGVRSESEALWIKLTKAVYGTKHRWA